MIETAASRALRLYDERRRRSAFMPAELLSDNAWDLMLWLFVETERGRRVSLSDAAAAASLSPQTALRWIAVLTQAGLVSAIGYDNQNESLMLTARGYDGLKAYLADL